MVPVHAGAIAKEIKVWPLPESNGLLLLWRVTVTLLGHVKVLAPFTLTGVSK